MYRGSKKHLQYMTGWNKEHLTSFTIRFNNETDKDIIDKLRKVDNKTDYLRQLITADIKDTRP